MSEQKAFHAAMEKNLGEHTPQLMYADWLEEHGKPTHAAIIRAHIARGHAKERGTVNFYEYPEESEMHEGGGYTQQEVHELYGQQYEPGEFRHTMHALASLRHHPDLITLEHRSETRPDKQFTWFSDHPRGEGQHIVKKLEEEGSFVKHPTQPEQMREHRLQESKAVKYGMLSELVLKAEPDRETLKREAHETSQRAEALSRVFTGGNFHEYARAATEYSQAGEHRYAIHNHLIAAREHGDASENAYFDEPPNPALGNQHHTAMHMHFAAAQRHARAGNEHALIASERAYNTTRRMGSGGHPLLSGYGTALVGKTDEPIKSHILSVEIHKREAENGSKDAAHAANLHREAISAHIKKKYGMEPDTPHGIAADYAEEHGDAKVAPYIRALEVGEEGERKAVDGKAKKEDDRVNKAMKDVHSYTQAANRKTVSALGGDTVRTNTANRRSLQGHHLEAAIEHNHMAEWHYNSRNLRDQPLEEHESDRHREAEKAHTDAAEAHMAAHEYKRLYDKHGLAEKFGHVEESEPAIVADVLDEEHGAEPYITERIRKYLSHYGTKAMDDRYGKLSDL